MKWKFPVRVKVPVRVALLTPHGLIATGLGSGLSPWLPGSVGSAAAVPFYLLMRDLPAWQYAGIVLAAFLLGWWASNRLCRALDLKDPGAVVIDEFVGLWVALFACPPQWWMVGVGFLVFRVFDMAKWPPPIGWMDRHLSGGWGIMIDDVVAGAYAWIAIQAIALAAGVSILV